MPQVRNLEISLPCNTLQAFVLLVIETLQAKILELGVQLFQIRSSRRVVLGKLRSLQSLAQDLVAESEAIGVKRRGEDLTLDLRGSVEYQRLTDERTYLHKVQ
jgi:hypothetical protein